MKKDIELRDEIRAFVMPQVALGTPVIWRPRKGAEAEIAYVYRVGSRNVHLATATKGAKEAVRHENDPKLKLNPEQREMGAWDFTDFHKQQEAEKAVLMERLEQLERQISSLIRAGLKPKSSVAPTPAPKKPQPVDKEYEELKAKCSELGIMLRGRPNTEKMRAMIAAFEQSEKKPDRPELINRAKELGIANPFSIKTSELIELIKEAENAESSV
jgi:hypothetical protein